MKVEEEILSDISHRPYPIPNGEWVYYQEWNRALFLHWVVPYELLIKCVPANLEIDTIEGKCYISVVAFTMEKIRPKYIPSIKYISDFDEINVRTYVKKGNKGGVYFLNIEAGKSISAFIAKAISGLPYEKSSIARKSNSYISENLKKGFSLKVNYDIKQKLHNKSDLDHWLTERYCLYLEKENQLFRYDIHHKEWELKGVELKNLHVDYKIGEIHLGKTPPDQTHYSEGIKVLAWGQKTINSIAG